MQQLPSNDWESQLMQIIQRLQSNPSHQMDHNSNENIHHTSSSTSASLTLSKIKLGRDMHDVMNVTNLGTYAGPLFFSPHDSFYSSFLLYLFGLPHLSAPVSQTHAY